MTKSLKKTIPLDHLQIRKGTQGEILRGECNLCGKLFYTTLHPSTAFEDIERAFREHFAEIHGPLDF
jgi:hypothetical protein